MPVCRKCPKNREQIKAFFTKGSQNSHFSIDFGNAADPETKKRDKEHVLFKFVTLKVILTRFRTMKNALNFGGKKRSHR